MSTSIPTVKILSVGTLPEQHYTKDEVDNIIASVDERINNVSIAGFYFEHTQPTPATQWNVNHNLGFIPNVMVLDENGDEIMVSIRHTDSNNLIITLTTLTAGKAILS